MLRKSRPLLLSVVVLASAVAAQAATTYIPTFSGGKYRGCTRYDDGVPTVTYLKVGLLACVVAGVLSTQSATAAVPKAASADMKKALQRLPQKPSLLNWTKVTNPRHTRVMAFAMLSLAMAVWEK